LLSLLIAFRAASLASGALPEDPTVPESMGVNIHFTQPKPGELEMLAAAGFHWVRMDFGWNGTEKAAGQYDFSAYERLLAALDRHHIRALFIFDYSNALYDQNLSPYSEAGRAAFARWAAAAAVHFQGRGILWEMYNEPNGGFWRPKRNAEAYAQLALAVGKALHEAAPNETYIGPATSGIDMKFLETCFKAGCLEDWAAVTVHPYRQVEPETVVPDYEKLRALIDRYAPAAKPIPIISGEWGYSELYRAQSVEKQGKYLAREFLINLASGIPLSIWYDWHDDGENPKDQEHHFGIVHHALRHDAAELYEPKPAYFAAKTLADTFAGFHFDKRLDVGRADDYVLIFTDGKSQKVAAWTTAAGPHDVAIPLTGAFHVVGHTGEALPDVTAMSGILTIRVTDAPKYLRGV
jgi:hypothetical protein